jgi:hypothetical protein
MDADRRNPVLNVIHWSPSTLPLLRCGVAVFLAAPFAMAEDFESVAARASRDYVRMKAADGSFVSESYAFANGGYWSGPLFDPTIDKMDFMAIARTIAVPLASQNYWPTADPKTTKLLLVVYWGTTFAPENGSGSNEYYLAQKRAAEEHQSNQTLKDALAASGASQAAGGATDAQVRAAKVLNAQDGDALSASLGVMQAENDLRDQANRRNAQMLGYDKEWNEVMGGLGGPTRDLKKSQMITELEEDRYFVVVMAYDYQLLVGAKKHKLLWETRYSIRQHTHAFNQQLMAMTVQAAKLFGQDSNGLTRKPLPDGQVELGAVKNLGVVAHDEALGPVAAGAK